MNHIGSDSREVLTSKRTFSLVLHHFLLLFLRFVQEKTMSFLDLPEKVVLVIEDSFNFFKRKVQDHPSNLTRELVTHPLFNVLIDKVSNSIFHVFVFRNDCGYMQNS